jgi:hypothetical protein
MPEYSTSVVLALCKFPNNFDFLGISIKISIFPQSCKMDTVFDNLKALCIRYSAKSGEVAWP